MSLTITNSPVAALEPVYNNLWFRLTSTLSTEPDFKYCFKINLINPVTNTDHTFISPIKLFPESDGSGLFSPARILESYLSFDFSPFGSGFTDCQNSLLQYKVKFGEELTLTAVTFSSITNNAGQTQYNLNSVASPQFLIGDVIKIDKTYKNYNIQYDGLQTITSVSGADITTDKSFGSANVESGSCISRLTYQTAITTSGTCYNGTRQYNEGYSTDFANRYILADASKKFLTDLSGDINIGTNDVFTLGAVKPNDGSSGVTNALVFTYDSTDGTIGVYEVYKSYSPYDIFNFRCGTNNLAQTFGYDQVSSTMKQVYTSEVKKYQVVLMSGSSIQMSEIRTFIVNDNCTPGYVRLAWLNPAGQFSFMNFSMKSRRKLETNRQMVTKLLPYDYSIGDRSEMITGTKVNEIITLNSEYMTDIEARHLQGLYVGSEAYWIPANSTNYFPIVILSKEYLQKSSENDELVAYQIEVRFAYDQNIQRN